MIKILVVDDSAILRNTVKSILELDPELEVVGCAENGKDAFDLCCKNKPDVILMDIRMPFCDGVQGTKMIKEEFKDIKIVILTTFDDDEYIEKALKYGADGYILKDIGDEELISVVKGTHCGLNVIQQNVFKTIRKQYRQVRFQMLQKAEQYEISDREMEIMKLIVDGKSNKEIANDLFLAEGSVRNMISILLTKFQLKDRTQLAIFAIKNHLI